MYKFSYVRISHVTTSEAVVKAHEVLAKASQSLTSKSQRVFLRRTVHVYMLAHAIVQAQIIIYNSHTKSFFHFEIVNTSSAVWIPLSSAKTVFSKINYQLIPTKHLH